MSITARITKTYSLNPSEDLVVLVVDTDGDVQEYIAIAMHPSSGNVSFRSAEKVTITNKESVWMKRTVFNGRSADDVVNIRAAITLDSRKITLNKSVDIKLKEVK